MSRVKRVLAAIALATLAGSTLLHAAAGTAAAAETEPAPRIEAILDASGSMKSKDASGQTRLEAAKQAVARLIDEVPDRASMGAPNCCGFCSSDLNVSQLPSLAGALSVVAVRLVG
ncbi:hypothetical protein ACFPH6_31145 [Streptomyces xiangluensis]|uniref:VWA domain-containing protein n=1 Tax=Streptomyces xiangluensis TaxID=2665720 RepID=A0ABV8YWE5_9ACTN